MFKVFLITVILMYSFEKGKYCCFTVIKDATYKYCVHIDSHSLHAGNFFMLFCRLLIFFKIIFFSKNSLRKTTRVSNRLEPDEDRFHRS